MQSLFGDGFFKGEGGGLFCLGGFVFEVFVLYCSVRFFFLFYYFVSVGGFLGVWSFWIKKERVVRCFVSVM